MRAGARGYLLKGANQAEILRAIRAVGNGEAIFGPGVARRLMGFFATPKPIAPAQLFPELTEREVDVLRLIAGGNANKEIATQLAIAEETVKRHVTNILAKLGANDRTHAVTLALKRGIFEL